MSGQLLATGKTETLSRIRFTSPVSQCSQKTKTEGYKSNQLSKAPNPFFAVVRGRNINAKPTLVTTNSERNIPMNSGINYSSC